jgi:hypothetical protein
MRDNGSTTKVTKVTKVTKPHEGLFRNSVVRTGGTVQPRGRCSFKKSSFVTFVTLVVK